VTPFYLSELLSHSRLQYPTVLIFQWKRSLKPIEILTPSSQPVTHSVSLITSPLPSQIVPQLAYSLQKGPNVLIGWGSAMEGVLYWITTVGTAIARGRREYQLFSLLNAKTMFDMAASTDGRAWSEGFVPIRTFIEFQQMCLGREIKRLVEIEDVFTNRRKRTCTGIRMSFIAQQLPWTSE
jgi:hypothetical protein